MFILLFSIIFVPLCYATRPISNEWAVVIDGGLETANKIATDNGFTCIGQIGNLENHYRFRQEQVEVGDESKINLKNHEKVSKVYVQTRHKRSLKRYTIPQDPRWHDQWSLNNTGQTNDTAGLDINIEKAWLQDLSGDGVLVGVIDTGVQWDVEDIKGNYDSSASYDFLDGDTDPSPDPYDEGASHGTSCAGEIAMMKNDVCGVGVAYDSKIAGLRIGLGSLVGTSDAEEADALGHMQHDIHIYSNSWGPPDDGYSFGGPGTLVTQTFDIGSMQGRNGKGSIYVWVSGNGGRVYDSCAADGYANSIYTIAIGSADQSGSQAFYDESCTAKMAVTYSLDANHYNEEDQSHQLVTVDLSGQCTDNFTGSSASVPLVSATIALVLERNPDLTWRDIQYLIAYTSDPAKLHGGLWTVNGGGLNVSSQFGFGAVDAEAMVSRATHWTNVPEGDKFEVVIKNVDQRISASGDYVLQFNVTSHFLSVHYTEHVLVTLNFEMVTTEQEKAKIGDNCDIPLEPFKARMKKNNVNEDFDPCVYAELWTSRAGVTITMTSPAGTESVILPSRPCDICQNGLDHWTFLSVHHWGEDPTGTWKVKISLDDPSGENDAYLVVTGDQTLEIRGVDEVPESVQRIPAHCDAACVRGCASNGSKYCDSCKIYRDPVTLECLDSCNETIYNGYCLDYNPAIIDDKSSLSTSDVVGIAIGVIVGVCVLVLIGIVVCAIFKGKGKRKEYVNIDSETSAT